MKPQILIVDEVLAVGDFMFREKCNKRMKEMLEGGTTLLLVSHGIDDIERLWRDGANYIGCGPFRFTRTKKNLSQILGLDGYQYITNEMKQRGILLPIVAIGGITAADIKPLIATGIDGIAVSGAILNATNPSDEMAEFIKTLNTKDL